MFLHPRHLSATVRTVTGAPPADDRLVAEWRALLERHARVSCALEKELQSAHGLGLSEFEVLDRLVESDRGSSRMSELTTSVHLSQSALSRAVARLEQDGLVSRGMCPDDRRAIFVCVTEEGRERHARARPTHRDVLSRPTS